MKKLLHIVAMCCFAIFALTACHHDDSANTENGYSDFTKSFIQMVDSNAELKSMLTESIAKCKQINPDKESNPVQSLEEYYDLVEWSTKCMPWDIVPQPSGRDLFNRIDQCLNYFYWLVDQELDELKDKDYYRPSLQYHEPFRSWLVAYTKEWGRYLSTAESWNAEYLAIVQNNEAFGLQNGWYEDPSNWHSFNDFFARRLSSAAARPIASPNDSSVVCSPSDSEPQGIWEIDAEGLMVQHDGAVIKSRRYRSTEELLANSAYRSAFKGGGTMTHTFLNVHDYHRYHFPMDGTIQEVLDVPGDEAIGGDVTYNPYTQSYVIECGVPQWQAIETRAIVVMQTQYGIVAVMPIGMSQICSCIWDESVKVGAQVKKGDPMGYFQFGGSDIVMLFQEGVEVTLPDPLPSHVLMGEEFCRLSRR